MPNHREQQQGMTDYGRKHDLLELAEAIENAKTNAEREYYEKIMYTITGESEDVSYWRNELMKATRVSSRDRKMYCIAMLQRIKLDESGGGTWGSSKTNRRVN